MTAITKLSDFKLNGYSRNTKNQKQIFTDENEDRSGLRLFIAGTGTVGGELLRQLGELNSLGFDPEIIGICNSRRVIWNPEGANLDSNNADIGESTDWSDIINRLTTNHQYKTVFVDATGSPEVSAYYPELLESGVHVVTPSKLANSSTQAEYDRLRAFDDKNVFYRYEAAAGAGLPVIQTIRNLVRTGDRVTGIKGVVSGTMTYIFHALEKGIAFSQAVRDAAQNGYSEPDPRDDLSGEDVARKFLILAREAGYRIEREDFEAENQTPEELRNTDRETFLSQLEKYDSWWEIRISEAKKRGEVLRYTGELKDGKIRVGVESVPAQSPLGSLKGTDNQISIYSGFYRESPIIIQGPGAGREVTAQAVLTDIRAVHDFVSLKAGV